MDILIFIVLGAVLLSLIGGFSLGVGSLFSSALKALYNLAEGSTSSRSSSPESGQERLYRKMPADLRDLEAWEMTEEQYTRYLKFLENYRG